MIGIRVVTHNIFIYTFFLRTSFISHDLFHLTIFLSKNYVTDSKIRDFIQLYIYTHKIYTIVQLQGQFLNNETVQLNL